MALPGGPVKAAIALALFGFAATAHADGFDTGPQEPPCRADPDQVVGFRDCPAYGMWGRNLLEPYTFVDIGLNFRHFVPRSTAPHALARSTMPPAMSSDGRGDSALMFDQRLGVAFAHSLYTSFEFELGNFANPGTRADELDFVLDALVSVGARGRIGPLALAAELAGGVMQSSYIGDENERIQAVLEPRGRVDLWLAPWFTIGGVVGASLIDRGDWMAGFYVGFHTWSYAGDRY